MNRSKLFLTLSSLMLIVLALASQSAAKPMAAIQASAKFLEVQATPEPTTATTVATTLQSTASSATASARQKWTSGTLPFTVQKTGFKGSFNLDFEVAKDGKGVALVDIFWRPFTWHKTSSTNNADNTFSVEFSQGKDEHFKLEGKFTSPTQAEGTMTWTLKEAAGERKESVEWTATPVTESSVTPKPGHWEGSNPQVSFDVTKDGHIKDLKIEIDFIMNSTCKVSLKELTIASDGKFDSSQTPEQLEAYRIAGQFDDATTMSGGRSSVLACGGTFTSSPRLGIWNAAWTNP